MFVRPIEPQTEISKSAGVETKGLDGQEIRGATQLQEVLLRIHGSTKIANEILGKISQLLRTNDGSNSNDDTHPSSTQILVKLARQNIFQRPVWTCL